MGARSLQRGWMEGERVVVFARARRPFSLSRVGTGWLASSGINNPHQHIGPGPSCLGELDARADGVAVPGSVPSRAMRESLVEHVVPVVNPTSIALPVVLARWVEGLEGWLWRGRATTATMTTTKGRTTSSIPTRMYLHIRYSIMMKSACHGQLLLPSFVIFLRACPPIHHITRILPTRDTPTTH